MRVHIDKGGSLAIFPSSFIFADSSGCGHPVVAQAIAVCARTGSRRNAVELDQFVHQALKSTKLWSPVNPHKHSLPKEYLDNAE